MTRRWEEHSKHIIVEQLQKMGANIDAKTAKTLLAGPSERDIVYSGLEDTMSVAVAETIATAQKHGVSYRIAGCECARVVAVGCVLAPSRASPVVGRASSTVINAITKIEVAYRDAGLTLA